MKKNLPISLLVLFAVFTVLSGNTSYQDLSLRHRSYRIKKTKIELIKNQSCDRLIGSSHPGYKFEMNSMIRDEILAKETNAVDRIIGVPAHNFFDDPISGKNRKGDEWIVNQVGGAGLVLIDRILNLPNFRAENWQNLIQFLFHKKRVGKNFFLEKNC